MQQSSGPRFEYDPFVQVAATPPARPRTPIGLCCSEAGPGGCNGRHNVHSAQPTAMVSTAKEESPDPQAGKPQSYPATRPTTGNARCSCFVSLLLPVGVMPQLRSTVSCVARVTSGNGAVCLNQATSALV